MVRRGIVAILLIMSLAACDNGVSAPRSRTFSGPAYTLKILASAELDDLAPVLADAAKATGVTVAITPTTSLAGSQTVASGRADGKFDATWLSTNRYLEITPNALVKLDSSAVVMSSPVILGLRASVVHRLGWDAGPVSWADIADAATHRFTFGMADPRASNSGLSALVSVATAVAGRGAALESADVLSAMPALRGFFSGQSVKAASSQELFDDYVRAQAGTAGNPSVDGLVDYESELLSLNASGKLREPLTLIYPSDGAVTADYTLSSLASAPPAAKAAYSRLVGYLDTPDAQRKIMQSTSRRPGVPGVAPNATLGRHHLFELPFPGTITIVDDLISAYYGTLRRPARTAYVLDTSESMTGDRLAGLKAALTQLTGSGSADPGVTFQTREQVTLEPFSTGPRPPTTFDVPATGPQPVLTRIAAFVADLTAGGGTAIYDALVLAYQTVEQQARTDPNRITTIVLLTDGENTVGRDAAAFARFYRTLPPAVTSIPVFPIRFGNGNSAEMTQLAQLTGGRTFDGRNLPLTTVFSLIRGSQ